MLPLVGELFRLERKTVRTRDTREPSAPSPTLWGRSARARATTPGPHTRPRRHEAVPRATGQSVPEDSGLAPAHPSATVPASLARSLSRSQDGRSPSSVLLGTVHPPGPRRRRASPHSLCCKVPAGFCRRRRLRRRERWRAGSSWARRLGSPARQPALRRRGRPGSRPCRDPGPRRGRLAGSGSA